MGDTLGRLKMPLFPTITDVDVVRLGESDLPQLSRLCLACTAFFELVEGRAGGDATAAEILGPLAPEQERGTKHVFGFKRRDELIGVAELLQGFPSPTEWFIGLLLLHPDYRGTGLGARLCTGIIDWIRDEGGIAVRLVVQHQNHRARAFWKRQGFSVEREMISGAGRLESGGWIFLRGIREVA